MENLEYRTMKPWTRGAHLDGILDGCNGVGHFVSYANSGVGHPMSVGDPGHLVLNPDPILWAKEGEGIDGLLMRQAASGPRKEGKRRAG
jgi:hypothetical protein